MKSLFNNFRVAICALVLLAAIGAFSDTVNAQLPTPGFTPYGNTEGTQSFQNTQNAQSVDDRLANVGPGYSQPASPVGATTIYNSAAVSSPSLLPSSSPVPPSAAPTLQRQQLPDRIARTEAIAPTTTNEYRGAADSASPYYQQTQQYPATPNVQSFNDMVTDQAEQLISREGAGSSVKIAILLAALSLAPALILMTTCYVRVVVVLTLLRQAFGAQQLPSTQILTALSLFVTFLVMAPTWNEIKTEAIDPYTESAQSESPITFEEAFNRAVVPVKRFMSRQIQLANNEDSVEMFYRYMPQNNGALAGTSQSIPLQQIPSSIEEVPLNVLMPAFLVSELKVAFLLGFQVFLPFLIVDLVVSSVTVSMGMVMLPPTMVSFPLKLILFVMVDGWTLVVGMLMQSFGPL